MLQDSGAVARFNREAANAARIEHERVARVFDFGETSNGLVYLAMEFVPGKTLGEVLEGEGGRLPATRAANLVYQIAEGLDAAHRISIVHRDLKPDNVLVITDEQGVDRCKVVDFGIAKAFDDSESRKTQLTQAGAIIGTPEFMSPEQVLGEQLDARSDVYALALVAYQLFTGELPFSATTPERSLTARLISDPQHAAGCGARCGVAGGAAGRLQPGARSRAGRPDRHGARVRRGRGDGRRGVDGHARAARTHPDVHERRAHAHVRGDGRVTHGGARQRGGGAGHLRRDSRDRDVGLDCDSRPDGHRRRRRPRACRDVTLEDTRHRGRGAGGGGGRGRGGAAATGRR